MLKPLLRTIGTRSRCTLFKVFAAGLVLSLFSPGTLLAQDQDHAVGVGKNCPVASKVGDLAFCRLTVTNRDDFGDDLIVMDVWDMVDPMGPLQFRNPAVGNLPITAVSAGTTCTPAPVDPVTAPLGLVFPCTLPGVAQPDGSGEFVRARSEYIVPAGATNPLLDQGNWTVRDACNVQPIGCNPEPQNQQFGAALSLFTAELTVTKTGPDNAKVGDEITYTIGFSETIGGLGFPGWENCTGSDTLLGDLGAFVEGVNRDFNYTVQPGDPNPLPNTATITCGVVGFDNEESDDDSHEVNLIDPSIDVTKSGPDTAKVGDEIMYEICLANTGTGALENCSGSDTLLGGLGAFNPAGECRNFPYTVQPGDPNPLPNTATITCDVVGFDNDVSDDDSHEVDLIDPEITVTKTGPDTAKVGDEITYTIGFTNTGLGAVENCTGSDTLLGALGAFTAGVNRDFMYTVQPGDPNPLPNTATITCDVVGFDNDVSDDDNHEVNLIDPAIDVTKDGPDTAKVGDEIMYEICLANTGIGALENCSGSDTLLGDLGAFDPAGECRNFPYTVQPDDPNPLPNTATITCDVVGFDNDVSDDDSHEVNLLDPAIDVTKDGPDTAKVGDEIMYEICFSNTGTGALENCSGSDTLLGGLGAFDPAGECRSFPYTVQPEDPNPLPNTATITCDVVGFDNDVSDDDSHEVNLIDPAIDVTKDGPDQAKVGDEIMYEICFSNTGTGDLENCSGSDTLLGDLGAFDPAGDCNTYPYTVQPDDPNPLPNTATVTCDVVGFDNQASDSDDHEVDLIDPEIEVTKDGPDEAKVGDDIEYEICFSNTGTGDLENCTGSDTLLGDLGSFDPAGECRTFPYTVDAGDPDPLPNTATITCDVVGFDNQASDSDDHEVDLFTVGAELSKMCEPDPVNAGDDIEWTITIDNTGEKDLDCLVNDATAGFVDEPLSVTAGGSNSLNASRTVVAEDAPVLSNTATAVCEAVGYDNVIDGLEDMADCEVIVNEEICRTPGFWKNRAGDEDHPRSTDLVEIVIAAAGGTIDICGRDITSTDLGAVDSALEAMCIHVSGTPQRQLARQLMAAALNCVISGGGADCTGTSIESGFAAANAACTANAGDLSFHIGVIDAFNNGEECHERDLSESDVFDGVEPLPGPAGSSKQCTKATKNDIYVVPVP